MSDVHAVIGALENARGPDRELDAAIALALGIIRERDGDCFYGHRDYSVMILERGYYDIEGGAPELPHFTASIDAALTLVEPGRGFNLDRYWIGRVDHAVWRATITRGGLPDVPYKTWGAWDAPNPALAICIAALKASGQGEE